MNLYEWALSNNIPQDGADAVGNYELFRLKFKDLSASEYPFVVTYKVDHIVMMEYYKGFSNINADNEDFVWIGSFSFREITTYFKNEEDFIMFKLKHL